MAITTVYDSSNYVNTSLSILREFILTYIPNVTVTMKKPVLNEKSTLSKPIIYLELLPGQTREVGAGRVVGSDKRGQFKDMSVMIWYIVNDTLGGEQKTGELGGKLEQIIPQHQSDLGEAGLMRAKISSLRFYPKPTGSQFYGGNQLITFTTVMEI